MRLQELRVEGFKSFGKRTVLSFPTSITAIVGPNGSGKSNVAEAFRFALGEQSMKTLRGRRGEDLIFNGGERGSRANKASVTVVFDNSDHALGDAFSEISISRTVYRDGSNVYAINDTRVRHRDVVEMLAKANIGASGHHIISQGEADRILCASPEDRKEMLEEGLGLRVLQYRQTETKKKMIRARENMAKTDGILREIAPRLRYLKRQVTRYEQARNVRRELEDLYAEYLAREARYVSETRGTLDRSLSSFTETSRRLGKQIAGEERRLRKSADSDSASSRSRDLQKKIESIATRKESLIRDAGRIEGELAALGAEPAGGSREAPDRSALERLHATVQERYAASDGQGHGPIIVLFLRQLRRILGDSGDGAEPASGRADALRRDRERIEKQLAGLQETERALAREQEEIRLDRENRMASFRQDEKNLFLLKAELASSEQDLAGARHALEVLREDEESLRRELREGHVLIGASVNRYKEVSLPPSADQEDRSEQKKRRSALERKKITLETLGFGGGEETLKEYEEVSERSAFLTRERRDLLASIRSCEKGVEMIRKELDARFSSGVKLVSAEFGKFFTILFGGGSASVSISKRTVERAGEEPEDRSGIAVSISLPRKKITSLEQLSGGERSLVSIALLFSISQITPPPFLILDETDAALDEANSRRYGDMIESLAERSQLILVTHNRETMHRAGALYGVTMGSAGTSSLLSVQFDEAVQAVGG